jgi:FtsP/CotA-like multicopper oxidase with cupredoxin domain
MSKFAASRRDFLRTAGFTAGSCLLSAPLRAAGIPEPSAGDAKADYTLHIKASALEIAPKRIVSAVTYNEQFPGPLLRFKEGQQATVDVFNETDTPEQLHWHGQRIPTDVDGAAEEGTPYIPAHGMRRIIFTANPLDSASTTPTIAPAPTSPPASTAAKLALLTLSRRVRRAITIAKCSWS